MFDDGIFLYLIKAIVMILLRHKNFIDLKWQQEQSDYNLIRNLKVNYKPYNAINESVYFGDEVFNVDDNCVQKLYI